MYLHRENKKQIYILTEFGKNETPISQSVIYCKKKIRQ